VVDTSCKIESIPCRNRRGRVTSTSTKISDA
jgi:hypothetical protein